jgi:transcriptional regulator with XRE-family HTH domain
MPPPENQPENKETSMLDTVTRSTSASPKTPLPADVAVGQRIRLRRHSLDMSQTALGKKLGVTFQQIQKYEKGTNRVGASRLQAIAQTLEVPVSYFFDENIDNVTAAENELLAFLTTTDGRDLIDAFRGIENPKARRQIINIARTIAEQAKAH